MAQAEVLDGAQAAEGEAAKTIAALDTLVLLAVLVLEGAAAVDYSSTLTELLRLGHLASQLARLEAVGLARRVQVQAAEAAER